MPSRIHRLQPEALALPVDLKRVAPELKKSGETLRVIADARARGFRDASRRPASEAVADAESTLATLGIGTPEEIPGKVTVQAVGIRGRNKLSRIPLAGIQLEASFGAGQPVTAAEADLTGLAAFDAPDTSVAHNFEISALGSDGSVVAVERGRIAAGAGRAVVIEVGYKASLAGHFEAGDRVKAILDQAKDRLTKGRARLEGDLEVREKAAKTAEKRLEGVDFDLPQRVKESIREMTRLGVFDSPK